MINWVYFREGIEDFDSSLSDLLSIFERHRSHIRQHTYFLNKALEWERNYRQTRYLLIGEEQEQARHWLKIEAQTKPLPCTPTDLHCEYITESIKNANNLMTQVFLCWEDQDRSMMEQIRMALMRQGFIVWMNKSDIRTGANYHQVIQHGIEEADNLVCLVSPASVQSVYCLQEVQYAFSLNKRIVPIVVQPIDVMQVVLHQDVDPNILPPGLANVQWIDFNQNDQDFDANFRKLLRALDTDPDHLRIHTRLLMRALEWDHNDRDESLLLRGSALREVQHWLLACEHKMPAPTEFQRHYVAASNIAQIQRQRSTLRLQRVGLALISVVTLVAIGLGLIAFRQYKDASHLQFVAQQGQILAETKTSEALFQSNRELEALLEAMRAGIQLQQDHALQQSDLRASVVTALQQAVFWVQEQQRIEGHQGIIWEVAVSPDAELIASASADGTVKIWRMDGTLSREFKRIHPRLAVAFTPDRHLVVGEADGTITVYSLQNAATKVIVGHTAAVVGVAVSPNGRLIASASEDGMVKLWNRDGKLLKTLEHDAAARSVAFSPDGKTLASASDDGIVRLWNADGTPLKTLR